MLASDVTEPAAEAPPEERLRFLQPGVRGIPGVSISPATVEAKDEASPPRWAKDDTEEPLACRDVRLVPGLGGGFGLDFGGLMYAAKERKGTEEVGGG